MAQFRSRIGRPALELAAEEALALRLELGEQGGIRDRGVLHHLREACAALARRQRRQRGGVDPDQARLVEGADRCRARR
jgi:hypothetical protein